MRMMQILIPVLMLIINLIYAVSYYKVKDQVFNNRKVKEILQNYKDILKVQIWLVLIGIALVVMVAFMEVSEIMVMVIMLFETIYVGATLILTLYNNKKFKKFREKL